MSKNTAASDGVVISRSILMTALILVVAFASITSTYMITSNYYGSHPSISTVTSWATYSTTQISVSTSYLTQTQVSYLTVTSYQNNYGNYGNYYGNYQNQCNYPYGNCYGYGQTQTIYGDLYQSGSCTYLQTQYSQVYALYNLSPSLTSGWIYATGYLTNNNYLSCSGIPFYVTSATY